MLRTPQLHGRVKHVACVIYTAHQMYDVCSNKREDVACTHGDVLNVHTEAF